MYVKVIQLLCILTSTSRGASAIAELLVISGIREVRNRNNLVLYCVACCLVCNFLIIDSDSCLAENEHTTLVIKLRRNWLT